MKVRREIETQTQDANSQFIARFFGGKTQERQKEEEREDEGGRERRRGRQSKDEGRIHV